MVGEGYGEALVSTRGGACCGPSACSETFNITAAGNWTWDSFLASAAAGHKVDFDLQPCVPS